MNISSKRILKDLKDLEKNKLEEQGIYYKTTDNLYNIKVLIIGRSNTPYENGYYFFDINIPNDYPFSPPKIKFCTQNKKTRFNPNLYIDGKVCLSIINTWTGPGWTSCNSLTSVLLSLQGIVFVNNPLHNEPGFENDNSVRNINYNKIISYENINTAIYKMIDTPPHSFDIFQDIMTDIFLKNYEYIIDIINKKIQSEKNNKTNESTEELCNAHIYGMTSLLNYNELKKKIVKLYNKKNQK